MMECSNAVIVLALCVAAVSVIMQVGAQNIPALMSNGFLDTIIQTRYLTEMANKVNMSDVFGSFGQTWQDWLIYIIGFAVCVAIGIVLIIVMLFACFIFPCCRCCGKCGGRDPEKSKSRKRSSGCYYVCYVALAIASVGMLLGAVGMYMMGNQIVDQLSGSNTAFSKVNRGLGDVDKYMKGIEKEMDDSVLQPYILMNQQVFENLDMLPNNAINVLDNATGMMTTLTGLQIFATNLPSLQRSLMQADSLALTLNITTGNLGNSIGLDLPTNFSSIHSILNSSECSQPQCKSLASKVAQSAIVRVDFSTVNLTNAIHAVNYSIQAGLDSKLNDSISEVDSITSEVSSSTSGQVSDAKIQSYDTEQTIKDFISSVSDTLNAIDFTSLKTTITDIESDPTMTSYVVPAFKWGIVGLASVVVLVTFFNVLGMFCGLLLPQRRLTNEKCGDKSLAARFLITGVALTFIFYWLNALLVTVLFAAGGLTHTELCRHIVNVDQSNSPPTADASAKVLAIFDNWLSGMLTSGTFEIRPFELYISCRDNASIYSAMHLEKSYNLSSKINTDSINKALNEIRDLNVTVPQVNITSPALTEILLVLDDAFGIKGLNFTQINMHVSGSVTEPDLISLADDLDSLNVSLLRPYSDGLRAFYNTSVEAIQTQSNQLQLDLSNSQSIIGSMSFAEAAENLNTSQKIINTNGTQIIDDYINKDVDYINNLIVSYVNNTVSAVEKEIGRCIPLHNSVAEIFSAACVDLLYPVNGFWFSLGWCIFFLAISIFLAVNLATMFRYAGSGNKVAHKDV